MTKEQPTTMAKEQPTTMAKEQPTRMAKEQPTTTATFSGQPMITTAQENRSVCSSFAIWTLLVALGTVKH
uniref:Uncharacterized protein n=1 Tax=Globodera pallida TaxID=36090 RepID=A0A183CJE7_GLOPA